MTTKESADVCSDGFLAAVGRIGCRINLFHALVISFLLATCSIFYHHGGMAHPEISTYLPHYISDQPLLNKLYDSRWVDINTYSARELSYFCDYLDCQFIALSVSLGHPHFISFTTYLFLIGIGLLLWHFGVRMLRLSPAIGTALLILFWTSPSIFLAGNYFRSSKYGVGLASALIYLLLYKYLNTKPTEGQRFSKGSWLTFFGISWIATLFDRQGVYMVGMSICVLLLWHFTLPRKKDGVVLSAFVASLMLSHIYNLWIGPGLIEFLNHYQPSFGLQDIPWYRLFNSPKHYIGGGISLYIDTLRFMLGSIPFLLTAAALLVLISAMLFRFGNEWRRHGKASRFTILSTGLILINVVLFIGLNTIMLVTHRNLALPDVRRIYYWVPEVTILYLTIALGLSHWKRLRQTSQFVLLSFAILANIYAIPQHQAVLLQGHLKSSFELSPRLLQALRNLNNSDYHPAADILEHPIYQSFQQRSQVEHR